MTAISTARPAGPVVPSVIADRRNGPLIAAAAALWIRPTDTVMDVTWGRGNWWTDYRHPHSVIAHDLVTDGVDFRQLPEPDASVDVVMFDPPYISPGGRATSTIPDFNDRYGLVSVPRTPGETLLMIFTGMEEIRRVLAPGGRLIQKSMDYVSSGRMVMAHHLVVGHALQLGLEVLDEFIHVTGGGPQPTVNPDGTPRIQVHSRRHHSFLNVFGVTVTPPRYGRGSENSTSESETQG